MRVVLDLETCSTVDLRRIGAQVYAEHADTRVTVACFAIDDDPVETWTVGQPPPARFVRAVTAGAIVVAHNYLFEFNVYHRKLVPLGWPAIPLAQWSCTLARAYVAGLPGALGTLSEALKLSIPKDVGARGLMLRMARPRSSDPVTGNVWWHETSPGHYAELQAYCRTDVEAERQVDKKVPELSPRERAIFDQDHVINQRGLLIDEALVLGLRDVAAQSRDAMNKELSQLSGGMVRTVTQVDRLRNWLAVWGSKLPDLRRDTVAKALREGGLHPNAKRALEIRRDISRSSVTKLEAIRDAHSPWDNRVRGCFQYYGASRTGRWAGRRLQPQNLFRGSIDHDLVPMIVNAVLNGAEPDDLELVFGDNAMSLVANCLRSCIVAGPGRKLVIVDYAQIEARVLAWLAGQTRALHTFMSGKDIYTQTAADIGSNSRLLGKVLVLACGFGMGPNRFQDTALSYGLNLDVLQCDDLVMAWRRANREIVSFWYACGDAIIRVTKRHCNEAIVRRVVFRRHNDAVLIKLPSGRHLVYRHAEINAAGEFSYMGAIGGGGWTRLRSWPGKIVENITQAVARDVLADALVVLGQRKIPLVGQVHDELIAEPHERDADLTLGIMTQVMKTPLTWAPGLPLDAKGLISDRYVKG